INSLSVSSRSMLGVTPVREPKNGVAGARPPKPSKKSSNMRSISRRKAANGAQKSSRLAGASDLPRQGTRALKSIMLHLPLLPVADRSRCDEDHGGRGCRLMLPFRLGAGLRPTGDQREA